MLYISLKKSGLVSCGRSVVQFPETRSSFYLVPDDFSQHSRIYSKQRGDLDRMEITL